MATQFRFWLSITLILFPIAVSASFDTITALRPLTGNQTIVSSGEVFELGFFTNGFSNKWYVGIWYKQIPNKTIVWVANRDNPVTSSAGVLRIGRDGNIIIAGNDPRTPLWSSNKTTNGNTIAQLLDTGNLILRRENNDDGEDYLWQSFDQPTDTLLPGMRLGWDQKTGLQRFLTSWRRPDDPSSGDFSFQLNVNGFPEIFLLNKQVPYYRSGPWNGLRFSGVPEMVSKYNMSFTFKIDPDEVSYSFFVTDKYLYTRLLVSPFGVLQRFIWIESSQIWTLFWYAKKDQCDSYKECGVYGICDTNSSPVCRCVKGFEPKNALAWDLRDGHDGCVRKETKLNCVDDGFLKMKSMKLPESSTAVIDKEMSLGECENACRRNCSCTAYSSLDIRGGGSGCVIWATDLVDLRSYQAGEGGGQDLYVKVPAADLEKAETRGSRTTSGRSNVAVIVGATVASAVLLLGLSICLVLVRKRKSPAVLVRTDHKGPRERSQNLFTSGTIKSGKDLSGEMAADDLELPLFDFDFIATATDNFSKDNRLGRGGFGIVYKGMTEEGEDIAVKRLSKNSGQGVEEFTNEMRLIARLQHRNLVRLLGCCIEMDEKMLIYEYLENRSLDSILFKKEKCSLLDWQKRFNIICGIARGLLYLHQDSRFRIIHRDLKASNILLDGEMIPKISDFGMARIFGGDETEGNTKRIVGLSDGYMSPEYAMDGLFSVKSDVFSFGVLVLEIVTGKKNKGFYNADEEHNLLGHAWKLFREGRGLELLDPCIGELFSSSEVTRCIQVGLLCVQERAEDRPTMATTVFMLSSENILLPKPKQPGFVLGRKSVSHSSPNLQDETCSVNSVTVTMLDGR